MARHAKRCRLEEIEYKSAEDDALVTLVLQVEFGNPQNG